MSNPQDHTIWCFIPGCNLFSVDIKSSEPVDRLKDEIKRKSENTLGRFDSHGLVLYRVEMDGSVSEKECTEALARLNQTLNEDMRLDERQKVSKYFDVSLPEGMEYFIIVRISEAISSKMDVDRSIGTIVPSRSKDSNASNASNGSEYGLIFNVKSKFISKREETVQEIWRAVERSSVVLVCGTPCSGKSTLGYLVARHAREILKEPYDTVYIPRWDPHETAKDILRKACTPEIVMKQKGKTPSQWRVFFIIDEAQTSYSDEGLWSVYLKACSNNNSRAKFLLLARYRRTSKWEILGPGQQMFPRAPSLPCYLQASISFNLPELTDAVCQYEREHNKHYHLTDNAIESLLHVSCGHAGLVISLLGVVCDAHETRFRDDSITDITAEAFKGYVSDTSALLVKLHNRVANRFLVTSDDNEGFPTEHGDLVKRILEQGPVLYNRGDASHIFVYQRGICQAQMERVRWHVSKPHEIISVVKVTPDSVEEYSTWVGENIWEDERTVLVFPTEIHARYFRGAFGCSPTDFPASRFESLGDFVKKALQEFSPRFLQDSANGRQLSPVGDPLPFEASYLQEFMRAVSEGLGVRSGVLCEWTATTHGCVDFYIPTMRWAVELLREGSQASISHHIARFTSRDGLYRKWVDDRSIREWLVVDCRTGIPGYCDGDPHLWYAIFGNDFQDLEIRDAMGNAILEPVALRMPGF